MAPLSSPAILPLAQGVPGDDQSMLQDSPEQNANRLHVLPPTDGFLWFYCFPNFAISQVLTKQICASSSLPIRRDKAGSCPGVFVSFATQIAANSNFFVLNPLFPKCDTGQTTPRQGKHCIALKKKKKTNQHKQRWTQTFPLFSAFGHSEPLTAIPHAAGTCHRRHFVHVFEAKF